MNEDFVKLWVKSRMLRPRQQDIEKIKSMLSSAELNALVTKRIKMDDDTATLLFREIYESIRQLGDVKWWLLGYEPSNHEISLEILKDFDIKEKVKLNSLERFKKTRHDINYRGFRASITQAREILEFWDICCEDISKILKKEIENKEKY